MSSSSWEAYTVGFVLVGSIAGCSLAGWWLDSRFGTSYWLPILFFVGVAAGFREMFITLGRINKQDAEKRRLAESKRQLAPTPTRMEDSAPSAPPARDRIFAVPPPPLPGFEQPKADEVADEDTESVEALLKRLMEDEDEKPHGGGSDGGKA